jgi:hypothetical protein
MSRDEVLRLLDDYVHGLLEDAQAWEVEEACERDPVCKAALVEARRRLTALKAVPPVEASGQLVRATVERVETHVQKQGKGVRKYALYGAGGLAAGVLILFGLQYMFYHRVAPTPFDLTVLGQKELLASTMSSLRIRLTDRPGNNAIAGAPITVELHSERAAQAVQLAAVTTDVHGCAEPRFQLPDWPDGDYQLFITAATADGPEVVRKPVQLKRSWQLMLSSDKPVYKPGQDIHVRSLALRRPDLQPVAGHDATFTIADPKGNIIFKKKSPTSQFGITAADCSLAEEILEGPYTIACRIGDTESKLQVEVKKYVLPKFKLEVKTDRPYYQPGEKAKCTVQADYFFGKPVADAAVQLEVVSTGGLGQQVKKLTARTNATGEASIELAVPDNPPILPHVNRLVPEPENPPAGQPGNDTHFSIRASVTDAAGQEQSGSVERVVTREPVRLEVIPESGALVQGVPNLVYVLVTRVDGTPVQANLTVTGFRNEIRTDERGAASFEYTPDKPQVRWTVRAFDAGGNTLAVRNLFLTCGQSVQDFLVRTDRAVYRGGQSVQLTALGAGSEPVFVDFIKTGKERVTLLSTTIAVDQGRGETTLDLPPDLFGTIELCAYRLSEAGVTLRKTRALYVYPPGQINIKTTMDKGEYRPGSNAKFNFVLTDDKGNPCPGALSLAAVDEAVFAVLQQAPGSERNFYTVDADLLKPMQAIHPWTPATRPGQEAPRADCFERALFAATAQSSVPGAPVRRQAEASQPPAPSHSLAVDSFADKVTEIGVLRQQRLALLTWGWIGLVGITLLVGYVGLWIFCDPSTVWKAHAIGSLAFVPVGLIVLVFTIVKPQAKMAPTANEATAFQMGTPLGADWGDAPLAPGGGNRNVPEGAKTKDLSNSDIGVDPKVGGEGVPVRVRHYFPETLLWKPELVTDNTGKLSLDVELAHSITSWRLSASAVAGDGRLGSAQLPVKVFQPFFVDLNLPVSLTRGDEVTVPAVLYNYLDKPQTVTLKLADASWFERTGPAEQRLDLQPGEVRASSYRLRVTKVGKQELQVSASAGKFADALKREIEVVPDGRKVEEVHNGTLQDEVDLHLTVPANAIEGSARAFVKFYPSSFSQVVEGLDKIIQMPYGCFEQTSSTTYPNILALEYLKKTNQRKPEVEAKAQQYIHLGYQRLLSFEVRGGGFEWFGHAPANRTLTAYGLMEFVDMARVHEVDPKLIERSREWLLNQRRRDGSWDPEGHGLHDDPLHAGNSDVARLATTAYIAWAVFSSGEGKDGQPTLDYLLGYPADNIKDPHILALVCNALLALDSTGSAARPYLERLDARKQFSQDGKFAWWAQEANARTTFYGAGIGGQVETTALAALAMLQAKSHPGTVRLALAWLVKQKDANGTWYSTQATLLSLKALLTASAQTLDTGKERRITVRLGQQFEKEIRITADQFDVVKLEDLTPHLAAGGQRLTIKEETDTAAGFQVSFRYHVPEEARGADRTPLAIDLNYDRNEVKVNEVVKATAVVQNRLPQSAAMVMLELPVPAGFIPTPEEFAVLVGKDGVEKYQVQAGKVLLYLRGLGEKPLQVRYSLRAALPVVVAAPAARVYEYYAPDRQGFSGATRLTVTARE